MAAFEAQGEDRKNDLCDEPSEDLELDEADNEPDDPQAHQRFIQARRMRVTTPEWMSPSGHLVPAQVEYRHDGADHGDGRWERLPAAAPAEPPGRR